jgi:type IV pilus assembly protein PilB
MSPRDEAIMASLLGHHKGLILVTGPTGSGKTTTLFRMIQRLATTAVNVATVEDPVEYQLEGVNQIQVNAEIGLTFAACLRAVLRQDPDVILIGEIRDAETAQIAVRAAMTGHLVLSTLHTNDAPSTLSRLVDLGCRAIWSPRKSWGSSRSAWCGASASRAAAWTPRPKRNCSRCESRPKRDGP